MTNWTNITKVMLGSYLEAALVAKLDTKDLLPQQLDRFTQAMTDVTNEFRGRLQAPPRLMVVSATANSVPPELVGHVCRCILAAMQTSCPAIVLEKAQVDALRKSWEVFDVIAKGNFPITMPSDPAAGGQMQGQPAPATIVCVDTSRRTVTMEKMRGL